MLKPDGAMFLMVYAPYGRAGVYMIQEYCRRLGVGTSEQEMNDLISVLQVMPEFHPLLKDPGLRARDFFRKLWWYDQVVFDTSK